MKNRPDESPIAWRLAACFAASTAIYAVLLWLAPRYTITTPIGDRPLLTVIGLYVAASAVSLYALKHAIRARDSWRLVFGIVAGACLLRALLLPTPPFQEIDIYRYLWDGEVVAAGIDPYAYPPQRIVDGLDTPASIGKDERLRRLVDVAAAAPGLNDILRTIHYAELPSPYPPVSQAAFATAAATSAPGWSADARLTWLKVWLTGFDLATLLLVIWLLRMTGTPVGWAIVYGWNPLVLKEIAGSGHLDAIATMLAVAALALAVHAMRWRRFGVGLAAAAALGLGVGAKLFPVILAPLVALGLRERLGWRRTLAATAVFLAVSAASLAPMLWPGAAAEPTGAPEQGASQVESVAPPPETDAGGKTAGLAAFLSTWEMNDLLFMIAYENVRSQAGVAAHRRPWFDITPERWSEPIRGRDRVAFSAVRAVTVAVYGLAVVLLAWRASRRHDGGDDASRAWLRVAFLTLAWFWLIAPTQNPWYWCWAVPLLPWAGCRAWLLMTPAVLAYYLRFWLEHHFPEPGPLGTPYDGAYFFYFVVPWIEFGPLLLWIALDATTGRRRRTRPTVGSPTDPTPDAA